MSNPRQISWLKSTGHNCSDEVVRHQFTMLASAMTVLFLGYFLSAFASTAIVALVAPLHYALFFPAAFLVVASWGVPYWSKMKRADLTAEQMRRALRRVAVITPPLAFILATPATGLTALYGSENASLAMIGSIALCTVILGSSMTTLPLSAILSFIAVQPAFYFPAIWHHSVLIFAVAVVASGILLSQAFIVVRQFALIARLAESESAAVEGMKKMASADQIMAQFLSNMGHEIRTPLNGVLGMAELLSRSRLDSRQEEYLSAIVNSGNRLLGTINNILDYSRIDAGQLMLDQTPFRLADVIEDVVHQVRSPAANKNIEVIQRIDPNLPEYLCGDATRLHQILANLIDNAVKFTDKGYVLVDAGGSVSHGTADVTIRVEDTGPGISTERLPQIFQQFAQVDSSSKRRYGGTGLGLAISARLVQLMGGEIGVESEVGYGSTFWLTMPLKIHEVTDMPRHVPIDVSGARILVIDDSEINRSIMAEQLRYWDFDCVAVESGPVGLAFIERAIEMDAPVDCVILDYQMPAMSGLEVARVLRSHPLMKDIPVIMLSSIDGVDFAELDFDPGLVTRLTKPARSATLRQAIVDIIQVARNRTSAKPETDQPGSVAIPEAEKADWISRARTTAHSASSKIDVLVAEDNEVNQIVFDQILQSTELRYQIVPNGRKAVDAYVQQLPRLILMDFEMPEMNGLEATRQIRRIETRLDERVTIIGVTAHAEDRDRQAGREAGMDDIITKPISPQSLLDSITHAIPPARPTTASAG